MGKKEAPGFGGQGAGRTKDSTAYHAKEQEKFEQIFEESQDLIPADGDWAALFEDYKQQRLEDRGRAFWGICYPDSMNPDFVNIVNESGVQGALSPLHDSDRFGFMGALKKAHFHFLLYFPGKVNYERVKAFCDTLGVVRLEAVDNIVGACRYLAHLDINPDMVTADEGKVRYAVQDILTFNGFDVEAYIKATSTQIARALKELYALVRENQFTAYDLFIDYVYDRKPEYEFVMANPHVCQQLSAYIKSRYARTHKDDYTAQLEQAWRTAEERLDAQERQQAELVGKIDSILSILKG